MPHSLKSKAKPRHNYKFQFEAIGTTWSIDIYEPIAEAAELRRAIHTRIEEFDRAYSRFREDSLVTQMSKRAGNYKLPPDAKPLMDLYEHMYEITGGEVTPLIGQTLADAGYDAAYSLRPGRIQPPPAWEDALDYRFPELVVKQPVLLDFGAAGKGYLVDLVTALVEKWGIESFCVDAGGDMAYRRASGRPITVGLEHPDDPSQVIGTVKLCNQSLCGSAGNRRAWGDYHHILSPTSLASPTHVKAVWVIADLTLLADAMTTCLFFVPAEKLRSHYNFEYALVRSDSTHEASGNLPGAFFT